MTAKQISCGFGVPSIRDVANELRTIKHSIEPEFRAECLEDDDTPSMDVRLQVTEHGDWGIHTGASCYDTDHYGFWGCGVLLPTSTVRELAIELLDQVKDHAAQCE